MIQTDRPKNHNEQDDYTTLQAVNHHMYKRRKMSYVWRLRNRFTYCWNQIINYVSLLNVALNMKKVLWIRIATVFRFYRHILSFITLYFSQNHSLKQHARAHTRHSHTYRRKLVKFEEDASYGKLDKYTYRFCALNDTSSFTNT